MSRLQFQVEAVSSGPGMSARAGRMRTLHNEVLTPVFMPVATHATVRAQRFDTLEDSGSQVLLANTYHLLLRPGPEVFREMGGIHAFMNWGRSVLTDSGGFQIFSLSRDRRMTEEGALFQSYWDGRKILLTPELSIETQKAIGSDIMMVLDECVPSTCDFEAAEKAVEITHRWAKRSLEARGDSPQALFGIIQGACFEELRKRSAGQITSLPLDGFAIGGLAVGETRSERDEFTEVTARLLPEHLPRYLMGVGTPADLMEAVRRGVDMFDCILPHALAQHGVCFTWQGKLELRKSIYRLSKNPIDPACACTTCRQYTRAYLHHLTKSREILGWQLIGAHNIHFYHKLMSGMRESILSGAFMDFFSRWRPLQELTDGELPKAPPRAKILSEKPRARGDYEVFESPAGFHCIRQLSSGELMHPLAQPLEEARILYIEQSQLIERLAESAPQSVPESVLWDVGLGAATNAMAAVLAYEAAVLGGATLAPLHIVSFERDLDSLHLALEHLESFPYLRHGGPFALREKKKWVSKKAPGLRWTLLEGDFRETLETAPRPDLVFFDPFSYQVDSELWKLPVFQSLFAKAQAQPCWLYTYSASTAVRAALLASGFFVARGLGAGNKRETTIAFTPGATPSSLKFSGKPLGEPLGEEWIERWSRSASKFPGGLSEEGRQSFEALVLNHEQFIKL